MLSTSREALGVEGEAVYEVRPLDPDGDGAELFRERAAALSAWSPDVDDLDRIPGLCAGLDGIPLAIELAAAQCRMLSVGQIADALENRFGVLVGGHRAQAPRPSGGRAAGPADPGAAGVPRGLRFRARRR
ncbi:hypothetical protein [Nonomuraea sp. NPDC049158]|uniref:hypothetical protein n=1 Tax=Nonomuraea sp. NPDC049158 TaxID=3155649 RepID=UPI0033D88E72